jgi:hypothetical protein
MHTPARSDEPAPSQPGITPVSPLLELAAVDASLSVDVLVPVDVLVLVDVLVPEVPEPVALSEPLLVPPAVPVVGDPVVGVPLELELDPAVVLPLPVTEVSVDPVSAHPIVFTRQRAIMSKSRMATNKQTRARLSMPGAPLASRGQLVTSPTPSINSRTRRARRDGRSSPGSRRCCP